MVHRFAGGQNIKTILFCKYLRRPEADWYRGPGGGAPRACALNMLNRAYSLGGPRTKDQNRGPGERTSIEDKNAEKGVLLENKRQGNARGRVQAFLPKIQVNILVKM